jgi:glyoxylase-like metal-dependent hydrolase (beta-lactamase superfamily II)
MTELTRRGIMSGAVAASAATALTPLTGSSASAAAPPVGKQAPGFYRYKVGTFEVTVATDGVVVNPLADNYVANAPKDAVNGALAANYLPADKATHFYAPIVVNTGAKLVVIDTGLGPTVYQNSKGMAGQFQTNIAAAGIDRDKVDTVIISHFHGDHINGLLAAENKPAYPNAEIMVPAVEWKYWSDDGNMSKAAAGSPLENNFKNVRRVFGALGNKVTQYDAGKEIAPGISSVASYGHTIGHTSHIIASGSQRVLVQADITAGMAVLFIRNANWQFAFDMDRALAQETRRKLYDMAIAEKMLVQSFHSPFPAVGYVEKDGDGYRWIPAPWNPTV